MTEEEPQNNNFGYRKVSSDQKQRLVNQIFDGVYPKYDLMNDLMSFGLHKLWKKELCKKIDFHDPCTTILDVASGSGDIAMIIKKRAELLGFKTLITLCDINQNMLKLAKEKAVNNNLLSGMTYICSDAENLPFEDNSFDYYSIGFGIRNVKSISKVLSESYRVLKPGGMFLCLEFSKIEFGIPKFLHKFYLFNLIPKLGKIVAEDEASYRYLAESIDLFPDQEDFLEMITQSGLIKANYQNMTLGTVALHSAFKPR
jgi:demethylmenaquinone methyltransferase/2-methoxy-6-polyprenyl-1,4-benzoquinol methylase